MCFYFHQPLSHFYLDQDFNFLCRRKTMFHKKTINLKSLNYKAKSAVFSWLVHSIDCIKQVYTYTNLLRKVKKKKLKLNNFSCYKSVISSFCCSKAYRTGKLNVKKKQLENYLRVINNHLTLTDDNNKCGFGSCSFNLALSSQSSLGMQEVFRGVSRTYLSLQKQMNPEVILTVWKTAL